MILSFKTLLLKQNKQHLAVKQNMPQARTQLLDFNLQLPNYQTYSLKGFLIFLLKEIMNMENLENYSNNVLHNVLHHFSTST